MYILQEMMRIDTMFTHQASQGRPMLMEMGLLDSPGLLRIAIKQPSDIGTHTLVDQFERDGLDYRAALKKAARELGLSRAEAYRRLQAERGRH